MTENAFKLPKIDIHALFAMQKANLASAQRAQIILLDAVQAIVQEQHGFAHDLASEAEALLKSKESQKPEAVLARVQAAAEKAVAVAKSGVDLGLAAQRRVAELATKRAQANLDELKALAA